MNNWEHIPKVYTDPDDAWHAVYQAGLLTSGRDGGLQKLETEGGEVSFLIPFKLTATAVLCYARAFEAGIKYAQHREVEAAERAFESVPDETSHSIKLFRAYTLFNSHYVEAVDEEVALNAFAIKFGYRDFVNMTCALDQTFEEAKQKLEFGYVTYKRAAEWIIRAACASEVYEDGRHHGMFHSSREWAIWHMGGETGENCQIFAQKHGLDRVSVWDAVEHSLSQRPVGDINDCWRLYVERRDAA
ncbi:hypothetical protein FV219_10485 [Methylobacterium sp. WL122]|nr:hypothetical protein FV219_10485 [Methylobacterium sp. WL122]